MKLQYENKVEFRVLHYLRKKKWWCLTINLPDQVDCVNNQKYLLNMFNGVNVRFWWTSPVPVPGVPVPVPVVLVPVRVVPVPGRTQSKIHDIRVTFGFVD